MEVFLLKTPHEISFTGNPMPVSFAITPYGVAEKKQDIRLTVRILVEPFIGSNNFVEVKSQSLYPDNNGKVELDIKTIINPNLEYYTPNIILQKPVAAINQVKRYKLQYLLQQNGALIGSIESSEILFAVKGGMAYDKWHPAEFFTQLIIIEKKPLQFLPEQKIFMDELRYFFWIYPFADAKPQKISIDILVEDGSNIAYDLPDTIVSNQWGISCMPVGFNQLQLAGKLPAGKVAISYTVRIDNEDNINIAAPFTFTIDHRNFYNTHTLLYRNSAGGIETLRLRGQIDFEADYKRQLAQITVPPSYFTNDLLMAQQSDTGADEMPKFKGDTGFNNQAGTDALRDFFLSPQKFHYHNGKLYPVTIITKNTKFFANRDNLISTLIEWQHAYVNEFFTPKALMPTARLCPAVERFAVRQINKSLLQIMYALQTPYSRAKVEVITSLGTQIFYFTGNSNTLRQAFTNPVTGTGTENITIKCYTICNEFSTPQDLGPATTIVLTVNGNTLPIANDDNYNIAAGFNSAVNLSPSAMANDSDPDGDAISVSPVTGGATNAGGTYSINAAGEISYTPPSSVFIGQDYFDYTLWETANHAAASVGRVYINVGTFMNNIYAAIVLRNVNTITSQYFNNTSAEVWVDFFADIAATIPVDITALNITANVNLYEFTQDSAGNQNTNNTTLNFPCTGTKTKIFEGDIYQQQIDPNGIDYDIIDQKTFSMLPGTGYVPI